MATGPSPNDLTRQQLDELDALLQRMLSAPLAPTETPMPVGSLVTPTPPAPQNWRVDPPAPTVSFSSPHLTLVEPPSSVALQLEAPTPVAPPVAPPPPQPKPQPQVKVSPPVGPTPAPVPKVATAPVSAPAPRPQPVAPFSSSAQTSESGTVKITPAPTTAPVPVFLLPFVALNALFDTLCGFFGPPGRLLSSSLFKYIYGFIGLGLLLYTAVHIAQERQLLTLPIQIPWPKH